MTTNPSSLLQKWYFCINEAGFDGYFPLVIAAVASARANTTLSPICIYGGNTARHIAKLTALGVTVIRHTSSFDADLRAGYGADYVRFNGHWLRVDLPLIDRSDDLVLYTDFDVIFLAQPSVHTHPKCIGAGPEFDRTNRDYFSSGVMVLNLAGLRAAHKAFTAQIRARLGAGFTYPAHDQVSYNRFFQNTRLNRLRGRAFEALDPAHNWKPFWGENAATTILHFHGPKPWDIRAFASGTDTGADAHRRALFAMWQSAPAAYAQALGQWDRYFAQGQALIAAHNCG